MSRKRKHVDVICILVFVGFLAASLGGIAIHSGVEFRDTGKTWEERNKCTFWESYFNFVCYAMISGCAAIIIIHIIVGLFWPEHRSLRGRHKFIWRKLKRKFGDEKWMCDTTVRLESREKKDIYGEYYHEATGLLADFKDKNGISSVKYLTPHRFEIWFSEPFDAIDLRRRVEMALTKDEGDDW